MAHSISETRRPYERWLVVVWLLIMIDDTISLIISLSYNIESVVVVSLHHHQMREHLCYREYQWLPNQQIVLNINLMARFLCHINKITWHIFRTHSLCTPIYMSKRLQHRGNYKQINQAHRHSILGKFQNLCMWIKRDLNIAGFANAVQVTIWL